MKFTLFGIEFELALTKPSLFDVILLATLFADIAVTLIHWH